MTVAVSDLPGVWSDSLTQVNLAPGVPARLAFGDSSRYSITFWTAPTGGTALLYPGPGITAAVGFAASAVGQPTAFHVRDFPLLPQREWWGLSTVGTTVTVYATRQQRVESCEGG